jgi:phosphohistidine swiveling domain-containing protein
MVAHANRLNDQFRHAMEQPTEMVKEHPLPSMLLMFGLGLGVGVVVAQTLCSSLMEDHEPTMTDKMRKQVYDALSHVVSPSMLKQFQNYTS